MGKGKSARSGAFRDIVGYTDYTSKRCKDMAKTLQFIKTLEEADRDAAPPR